MCLYSQDGRTALHLAAQEGRVDVVRLLIETQAQVNIQDEVPYMRRCTAADQFNKVYTSLASRVQYSAST